MVERSNVGGTTRVALEAVGLGVVGMEVEDPTDGVVAVDQGAAGAAAAASADATGGGGGQPRARKRTKRGTTKRRPQYERQRGDRC